MIQAVPLEEDLASLDVYLLGDPLYYPPRHGTTEVREIPAHQVVDREQSRALRGDEKVVLVSPVSVARFDPLYLAVGTVEDYVLPDAGPGPYLALPPSQHRLAPIMLHLEVQRIQTIAEPDGPSHVVDDHRSVLSTAYLRGDKDVSRGPAPRPRGHRYGGRLEVRARAEVPRAPQGRGRNVLRRPHL